VQQVAAQMVAQDIVPVQPMEAPNIELVYGDWSYSGTSEPNRNGRVYNSDAFRIALDSWEPIISGITF
jgi:hypothetical protein